MLFSKEEPKPWRVQRGSDQLVRKDFTIGTAYPHPPLQGFFPSEEHMQVGRVTGIVTQISRPKDDH